MDPRYPIGKYTPPPDVTPALRRQAISTIAEAPAKLRAAAQGLNDQQLNTPYREGGWTVRQVVHHYADDHMNGYFRFKLALTEDTPLVKGWSEPEWAELPDGRTGPIEPSLALLSALHERWVAAWKALDDSQWNRLFVHPVRGEVSLNQLARLYDWHGKHHTAQIRNLRTRNGW